MEVRSDGLKSSSLITLKTSSSAKTVDRMELDAVKSTARVEVGETVEQRCGEGEDGDSRPQR